MLLMFQILPICQGDIAKHSVRWDFSKKFYFLGKREVYKLYQKLTQVSMILLSKILVTVQLEKCFLASQKLGLAVEENKRLVFSLSKRVELSSILL